MSKHSSPFCFLPLPRLFQQLIHDENALVPVWLVKTLDLEDRIDLNFKDLSSFTPRAEILDTLDSNSLSAINDLCLNILKDKYTIQNSPLKLGEYLSNIKSIPLDDLPFRGKVFVSSLAKRNILNSTDLASLSLKDIFKVPAGGLYNVFLSSLILERFCSSDNYTDQSFYEENSIGPNDYDLDSILETLLELDNIDSVNLSDTRFKDERKTLKEYSEINSDFLVEVIDNFIEYDPPSGEAYVKVAQALFKLENKLININESPFLQQIDEPFQYHIQESDEERRLAISDRFGLKGRDIPTLRELGNRLNITHERVRQIEERTRKRIQQRTFFIPKLDEVLYLCNDKTPVSERDLKEILSEKGYGSFTLESIKAISELYERDFNFKIKKTKGVSFLTSSEDVSFTKIMSKAKSIAGKTGLVNSSDLADNLFILENYEIDSEQINATLKQGPFKEIADDWFASTDLGITRNRLKNIATQMLYCVNPINVKDIREGVKRFFFWRKSLTKDWPALIAPNEVIQNFLISLDGFSLNEEGLIFASKEIIEAYNPSDKLVSIKSIIKAQPYEIIDNRAFFEAAKAAGIKEATFSAYCSYQPYITNFDFGVWGLRGSKPRPEDIASLKEYAKYLPRKKRKLQESFNERGQIELTVKIDRVSNALIHLSKSMAEILGSSDYIMKGKNGIELGTLHPAPSSFGTYVGSGQALTRLGVESEDLVRFTFDIDVKEVLVEAVPESTIWEMD